MMNGSQSAPSLFTILLALLGGGGVAALVGAYLHWRRQPAEVRQITVATDAAQADIIHKSVEAAVRTGEFTLKAMERAEAEIEHLTARKVALEAALQREMDELRRKVEEVDAQQAEIFLILGERRKVERQGGE